VSLAPFERLCRICGTPNAVIFRLQDKTEVVERVNAILTLNIDLKVSQASNGIQDPSVRKCFSAYCCGSFLDPDPLVRGMDPDPDPSIKLK
jgi:hypothetical protein